VLEVELMDWIYLNLDRNYCQYGSENSVSIKGEEFLD
jgi:hypothetical protein